MCQQKETVLIQIHSQCGVYRTEKCKQFLRRACFEMNECLELPRSGSMHQHAVNVFTLKHRYGWNEHQVSEKQNQIQVIYFTQTGPC